jgi:hypothetical protein
LTTKVVLESLEHGFDLDVFNGLCRSEGDSAVPSVASINLFAIDEEVCCAFARGMTIALPPLGGSRFSI